MTQEVQEPIVEAVVEPVVQQPVYQQPVQPVYRTVVERAPAKRVNPAFRIVGMSLSIFGFAFSIFTFIYSLVKKVPVYEVFTQGVKSALSLIYSIFPAILSVLLMSELFRLSGVYDFLLKLLSPVFSFLGVPFIPSK